MQSFLSCNLIHSGACLNGNAKGKKCNKTHALCRRLHRLASNLNQAWFLPPPPKDPKFAEQYAKKQRKKKKARKGSTHWVPRNKGSEVTSGKKKTKRRKEKTKTKAESPRALRFLRLLYTARSSASGLAGSFNPSSAPRLRPRLM